MRSRRRQRAAAVQKLQHAVPAAALLFHGLSILEREPAGVALALGIVEIGTSVLLLAAMARSLRRLRRATAPASHHAGSGIDWVDIFVAGVLAAEALERWHEHGHLARPTLLLAAVVLAMGLAHGRIAAFAARRRALRVTAAGLSIPRRPFGRFTASWTELAAITIDDREAVIRTVDGRTRRIDLQDVENAPEVVAGLAEARRRLPPPGAPVDRPSDADAALPSLVEPEPR